nr:uncharacterized protein LOC106026112 [Cavia porcellus]
MPSLSPAVTESRACFPLFNAVAGTTLAARQGARSSEAAAHGAPPAPGCAPGPAAGLSRRPSSPRVPCASFPLLRSPLQRLKKPGVMTPLLPAPAGRGVPSAALAPEVQSKRPSSQAHPSAPAPLGPSIHLCLL